MNPRPLAGEGRVRVLCPLSVFSKEHTKVTKFGRFGFYVLTFVLFVSFVVIYSEQYTNSVRH